MNRQADLLSTSILAGGRGVRAGSAASTAGVVTEARHKSVIALAPTSLQHMTARSLSADHSKSVWIRSVPICILDARYVCTPGSSPRLTWQPILDIEASYTKKHIMRLQSKVC